jgi:hypothetical protein
MKKIPVVQLQHVTQFFGYFSIAFLSICFSSLESLIITNVGARGKNYLQRPRNVSSPVIVATCFNA